MSIAHCNGSIGNQYDCKRVHFQPITGSCPLFHANPDVNNDLQIVNACVHQQPAYFSENNHDNLSVITNSNAISQSPPQIHNHRNSDNHFYNHHQINLPANTPATSAINSCQTNCDGNINLINTSLSNDKHITMNLLAECSSIDISEQENCDCISHLNDNNIDNLFINKQAINCDCKQAHNLDEIAVKSVSSSPFKNDNYFKTRNDCCLCKLEAKKNLNTIKKDTLVYCDAVNCNRKPAISSIKSSDNQVTYLPFIILVIILTISTSFLIIAAVLYIKCKSINLITSKQ